MGKASRKKKETTRIERVRHRSSERHYVPPKPLVRMDLQQAQVVCGHQQKTTFTNCPLCTERVAIHCPDCGIQVTGCGCTLAEKVREAEDEARRERLKTLGVVVPSADKELFIARTDPND